jgi:4-hydroxyphenylpyruvate dioxygenase
MSLGRCYAGHSVERKLSMAAKHGLQGIELFYEDLADLATPQTPSNLLSAAAYVRSLCKSLGLEIICLQPFMHYEGLFDRSKHAERIEEMHLWIQLAKVLDTDLIQVPSTFLAAEETSDASRTLPPLDSPMRASAGARTSTSGRPAGML